jgi:outer membrane protein OmpA-like peptidoglycan-associated protein
LLVKQGVQANRINAIGYGESRPVATNATPEGRRLNRRVEIRINPNTQG